MAISATRLVAISGPLRNSEFRAGAGMTIGSNKDNTVVIEDFSVSPYHCRFAIRGDQLILTDLDSRAGTFVNGIPVKERELKAGDEIVIGNSSFLFEAAETESSPSNPVEISELELCNVRVVNLPERELVNLSPEQIAALPKPARLARNFGVLLEISREIGSLRDEESLPWQLLAMIFEVIPAERGAIFLLDPNSGEVQSRVAWDRVTGPDHPVHVGQEIIKRVITEKVSLTGGVSALPESGLPNGTATSGSQHLFLCVPMLHEERTVGIIYLESSSTATSFNEDDFPLLSAISSLGVVALENTRQFKRLGTENQRLRAEVSLTHDMVGHSQRMREVYQFIERVAPSDATILIGGESGTGKELAARAIHKNSPRKGQPFVALNCAALSETLMESELFGHEKGAFTSAIGQKKGFLEVAEGGTIFLDEIGELSPVLQAKLLRVLQEREFVRVGGTRPIKINVRFLAATNRDLQKSVRDEGFRADLYHRLNVISITLPALREHREDIPLLAEHFAARHGKHCNRAVRGLTDEALACLTNYDWPGNIRELENAMERAVVVGFSEMILLEDLPETVLESMKGGVTAQAGYQDALRQRKKQLILSALEQAAGNITDAAKLLGVHPNYLHRLLRNLELRPSMKRQTGA